VFSSELWATTAMSRPYGRAPAGQRLVEAGPAGHRHTATLVAALRVCRPVSPLVVGGAIIGKPFEAYARQVQAAALRRGDSVVMGNLSCHKVAGAGRALRAARCRALYLPPYSPGLNPIRRAFAWLKALPWRGGERLGRVKAEECRNDFRHCGYAATHSRNAL
jgi:hypothetical protein